MTFDELEGGSAKVGDGSAITGVHAIALYEVHATVRQLTDQLRDIRRTKAHARQLFLPCQNRRLLRRFDQLQVELPAWTLKKSAFRQDAKVLPLDRKSVV